jgi:hypothetical protein
MEGQLETYPALTERRRSILRALLAHPFVTLLVVGVLVGSGLRFLPAGSAAGSSGAGQTACAAK